MQRLALLLDFDGTITEADIGARLIRRFGARGWDRGLKQFRAGEIGVRELLEWETAHLPKASLGPMLQFAVAAARMRPGLRDLVNFACEHKIPVEVVSNGWDFYIREILQRNGFADLRFCSPHAVFQSGEFARLSFGEDIEVCATTGLCKCERVRLRTEVDRTVVYVGDGISDFCVAREAGIVMARRELAEYCDEQGISYIPYQDMFDVLAVLKRVLNGETAAPLRRPQPGHGAHDRAQTTVGPS